MVSAPPPVRPPGLSEAQKKSTTAWQTDLQALFHQAKDRFPDVVWDLTDEDALNSEVEEVWGHKAIVYARAPPSFQARYFQFRPAPITSPLPFSTSPTPTLSLPTTSALSLTFGGEYPYSASIRSGSPAHFRSASPAASSTLGTVLRLPLTHNPALFSNELEYLYTGKGLGEAFEFLFDTNEKGLEGDLDAEEARIDKLRKDLVFMWRSRLYSDVRIELMGDTCTVSSEEETTAAVFSSHRFVLVSRSPYFYDQLVTYGLKGSVGEQTTLRLPSPPFTPPALHFTLGFLYSGTLNFSNRTYDLDTAFAILCSASYLQLQSLYDEIQARLVQEMLHGLFHAFLEFSEYERITGGKWGTGGCKCRQCARRAPRTLEFAVRPDVKNIYLEHGARRALVGLFGEGWCNPEFAGLPQKTKDGLLKGLAKRTTPQNVFPLLFASHAAMNKLNNIMDSWADGIREMVLAARKVIDDVLCNESEKCFVENEWIDIMENDGMGRFEDGERVEWVMEAVKRGVSEMNAGVLYQTLVSSILLRPHPTEPGETLLSGISQIRVQVEQTRMDILRWLRRRWMGVRQKSGFDSLEGWAVKEISHEIDVPVEDLLNPQNPPARGPLTRTGLRPSLSRVEDASERDTMSVNSSLRTSVLSKNMTKASNQQIISSGASIRSVARSVASTASQTTTTSAAPSGRTRLTANASTADRDRRGSRPDSKLAPTLSRTVSAASSSRSSAMDVDTEGSETPIANNSETALAQQAATSAASRRPGVGARVARMPVKGSDTASLTNVQRPKSSAPSVSSVRSHASTVRKNATSLRPPPSPSRPASTLSTRSEATTASSAFKTARESIAGRSRRISTASTVSTVSARNATARSQPHAPSSPLNTRQRRLSETSVASVASTRSKKNSALTKAPAEGKTLVVQKSSSSVSMRSNTSVQKSTTKRAFPEKVATNLSTLKSSSSLKENIVPQGQEDTSDAIDVKGKARADSVSMDDKSSFETASIGIMSDTGSSSTRGTLKRRESNDTITISNVPHVKAQEPVLVDQKIVIAPRGATLDIGIPCIIWSKRKRFRAFARYIGEVEGEVGPWVGVEVPIGEAWGDEQLDGRQWNDGSWGGVRYFEVGASSEWGDDDGASRNRHRREWMNGQKGIKREGDHLHVDRKKRFRSASPSVSDMSTSDYRGLFVRPQQVLYVVDAVGSDL